jgi:hypothetical protein
MHGETVKFTSAHNYLNNGYNVAAEQGKGVIRIK